MLALGALCELIFDLDDEACVGASFHCFALNQTRFVGPTTAARVQVAARIGTPTMPAVRAWLA